MTKFLILLPMCILASCCQYDYDEIPDDSYSVDFKTLSDTIITDSIRVRGLNANTDTITKSFNSYFYNDKGLFYARLYFPLRITADKSSFEITYRDRKDTLTLTHSSEIKSVKNLGKCSHDKYGVYFGNIKIAKITLDTIYDEKYYILQNYHSDLTVYYK